MQHAFSRLWRCISKPSSNKYREDLFVESKSCANKCSCAYNLPLFSVSRQGCLLLYTRVASTFMSLEREVCVFVESRGVFVSSEETTESQDWLTCLGMRSTGWTCLILGHTGAVLLWFYVLRNYYVAYLRKEGRVEADGAFYWVITLKRFVAGNVGFCLLSSCRR